MALMLSLIRGSVPLSNRNLPYNHLTEKRNLNRFRYENTDLDPMKSDKNRGLEKNLIQKGVRKTCRERNGKRICGLRRATT